MLVFVAAAAVVVVVVVVLTHAGGFSIASDGSP